MQTPPFSDIDLSRWKDYDDIITETLWLLGPRDKSGSHVGDYWGNFVPQVPNQLLRRFTKRGDVVADLFCGMGTTLIECRRLGRHGIGVELLADVAERARARIELSDNPWAVQTTMLTGDSRLTETSTAVRQHLRSVGRQEADCVILHPPYHDIIRFSDDPRDLSNAGSLKTFLSRFGEVVDQAVSLLAPGRHLGLVIGDLYANEQCIPLGFYCAQECMRAGLQLKAINVKDIQGNERGKGKNENLWRYRALRFGLYIFKHEYIMLFTTSSRQRPPRRKAQTFPATTVVRIS